MRQKMVEMLLKCLAGTARVWTGAGHGRDESGKKGLRPLQCKTEKGSCRSPCCGGDTNFAYLAAWSVMKPIFLMLLRWAAAMACATFS